MRNVNHADQFTGHLLAKQPRCNSTTQHDVAFTRVAHGLVRQHAGQCWRQHHRLHTAARWHRVPFGLQVLVQLVELAGQVFGRQIAIGGAALPREGVAEFNRAAIVGIAHQRDITQRALDAGQRIAATAGGQPLAVVFVGQQEAGAAHIGITLFAKAVQGLQAFIAFGGS